MYFKFSTSLGLALLLAVGCPAGASTQLDFDGFEIDPGPTSAPPVSTLAVAPRPLAAPAVLPHVPSGLVSRARLAPPASRLRCWQHGVSVVDESWAGSIPALAGALTLGHDAAGQNLVLLNLGTGLCVLTSAPSKGVTALPF